jgi:hypothetical protein
MISRATLVPISVFEGAANKIGHAPLGRVLKQIISVSWILMMVFTTAQSGKAQSGANDSFALAPTGSGADQIGTPPKWPSASRSYESFSGLSFYFGLGTAIDRSSGKAIDTFGNGTLYNTPRMAGLFGSIGGDWAFWQHWGIGFRTSFRGKGNYAGLDYRPLFYDFDTTYEPLGISRRIVPEFQGGLGGLNLRFYESQNCDAFAGCSNANSYLESSNHFQLHFSAGLRVYVKDGLFISPEFDGHWVKNFFQFGGDFVPEYGVAIGYTFGRY